MKKTKILYWVFTSLFAFVMAGSALPDIFSAADAVKGMHGDLGYPLYFIPFIGVMKMLGVIAILISGYARIKEWAYAGLTFDLIGTTFSIIASGHAANATFMLLPLVLAALAYIFYHKKLRAASLKSSDRSTVENIYQPARVIASLL